MEEAVPQRLTRGIVNPFRDVRDMTHQELSRRRRDKSRMGISHWMREKLG